MVRKDWETLNGSWEFEIDYGKSGFERKLYEAGNFSRRITVPFCPESKLSGIGHKDFMPAVWYRRSFVLPKDRLAGRVLLHFGAVDYKASVYVNGRLAGTHSGGYVSFTLDISHLTAEGANTLVLCAEDDVRGGNQPRGKQSDRYESYGCLYTRTTGIWQTVWLEYVPDRYIKNYRIIPDPENGRALLTVQFAGTPASDRAGETPPVEAAVSFEGREVCRASARASGNAACLVLPVPNPALWDPGTPNLYDLDIAWGQDRVKGYFGMRSVSLTNNTICINGRPVYQRLVLDQGFYPDGIYTAPSDDDLRKDIELSQAAGFNGARLHQKVFEERFLYWADKLGYIVWGEHASWGLNIDREQAYLPFATEWREIVERDFNHPAIVGWCPFNETGKSQVDGILRGVYDLTKQLDPTRPVIDASGYVHVSTDVLDTHDYEQDPAVFKKAYAGMTGENVHYPWDINGLFSRNIPYFVSEYGGTWWNAGEAKQQAAGWGYGNRCKTIEEVYTRIEGLTKALLDNPRICAFCYTQLTDVEQEQNGIYTYDRRPKFDINRVKAIFGAPAAIEKSST
jgi:beta-galactosidase/beta-glucuronidase